jgi:hypothetical protein
MAEELLVKYGEMLAMRLAHDSGDEVVVAVKEHMAGLASRFPGALREMDDLELVEIRRRIDRLKAVLTSPAEEEPWMEAVWAFHAEARGAFGAKRWLDGRKRECVDATLEEAFVRDAEDLPFSEELLAWAGHLASVASPPAGRVTNLVFARLAVRLGTTEKEARRRVFGPPRRARLGREGDPTGSPP